MGRRLAIEWEDSADKLKALYKAEKHPQRRTRLQGLWHLCSGKRIQEVVEIVEVSSRAVQNWVAWYWQAGLQAMLEWVTGCGSMGVGLPHEASPTHADLSNLVAGSGRLGGCIGSSWTSLRNLHFAQVYLPAYSPELNPPERVFAELRRAVEGQVYASLVAKRRASEHELGRLNANKLLLRRLTAWHWIDHTLGQLPDR